MLTLVSIDYQFGTACVYLFVYLFKAAAMTAQFVQSGPRGQQQRQAGRDWVVLSSDLTTGMSQTKVNKKKYLKHVDIKLQQPS